MFRGLIALAILLAVASAAPATAADSVLLNDGDSLLAGDASPDGKTTTLDFICGKVSLAPSACINVAVSGWTLRHLVETFATRIAPRYQPQAQLFVVHILGGGNDIRRGAQAQDLYVLLQHYVEQVHALGANAKAAVSSYPLQCDMFRAPRLRATVQALNDLVAKNWSTPRSAGGIGADVLVDYFGDPEIGPGTYDRSAFCNAKLSKDGGHLWLPGKSIMAGVEWRAVRPLFVTPRR